MPVGAVRLAPFLAASVAVHAIVLVAAGPERVSTITSTPTGNGIEVSVRLEAAAPAGAAADSDSPSEPSGPKPAESAVEPDSPAPTHETVAEADPVRKSEPKQQTPTQPRREPEPEPHRRAETRDSTPEEAASEQARQVAEVEQAATGADETDSRAQAARSTIVARLAKYFRYPRLAQRRGWEGTVILSVRVLPDGRLTDIRIERSSGRSLLDHAAFQSLAHIERLPELAGQLGENGVALEIPVTYRLESA